MRVRLLIIFLFLATCILQAQIPPLVAYEYWFNQDYSGLKVQPITPAPQHTFSGTIDVSSLPNSANVLNIRYKDANGVYSSTLSKIFVKLAPAQSTTASNLVAYEYWFNNDYDNARVQAIAPTTRHSFVGTIDVSELPNSVNVLNVRYKDANGVYSSTLSKIFVKLAPGQSTTASNLVAYEYWFNNDYDNARVQAIAPTTRHSFVGTIDVSELPNSANVLNIRYKDANGVYSSTLSKIFVKLAPAQSTTASNLVAYEYWFNNDYDNARVQAIAPTTRHSFVGTIDASELLNGVNVLNIRYKDANGLYSSTVSKIFVKLAPTVKNNKIVGYHYWFDDDFANRRTVTLANPVQQANVLDVFDVTRVPKGNHRMYYQFLDSTGVWSVVNHHDFVKNSFPISEFDYELTPMCDSTVVAFTNTSIDGDTNLWDFGDGNTSSDKEPTHVYFTPGTYTVVHTVRDTITLADSTSTKAIHISSDVTHSTIEPVVCDSYTSPSGKVFTQSGTYLDTIPNHLNCDSVITVNLTVNPLPDVTVLQQDESLQANQEGASYQWLNCDDDMAPIEGATERIFIATESGNYAVEVTLNGCVKTSDCYLVTKSGIIETTFDSEIIFYPNPTDGLVKIDLGKHYSDFTVNVCDITGRAVMQQSYKDTRSFELNLDVQPGAYIVRIDSGNRRAILHVIKR